MNRLFGNVSVNYQDKAFWTDVLTDAYHGFTNSYTLVNAAVGLKWMDGRLITSVKAQNIANDNIQQHIFGDIIKRSIYGEVRLTF